MDIQKKQYIVSITNIAGSNVELVGQSALDFDILLQSGLNIQNGFVITSTAFDDFLVANELLDYISPRINEINYNDLKTVKKASAEIMHAIETAIFPNIIGDAVIQAYTGLSGFTEAFVSIEHSPINNNLNENTFAIPTHFFNIAGRQELLKKIKELWAKLFSPESLLYRGEIGYEGYITDAILIRKMSQAEISGKAYTFNSISEDKNVFEIQAFFGLNDDKLWQEMTPDSYLLDAKSGDLIEKKILGQEWMLVRKGRAGDRNPIIKVPISKLWQKKQKIDDKVIIAIYRYLQTLSAKFRSDLEISWDYEAGRIIIRELQKVVIDEEKNIPEEDIKHNEQEVNIDRISSEDIVGYKDINRKSIDEYVNEVEQIQDQQLVVDVKPVEELQLLVQGIQNTTNTVFGLAHYVFTDNDYFDLNGDELLIVRKVNALNIDYCNQVKGLIIKEQIDDEVRLLVKVPYIEGIIEAYDIFQEGEILTIRPWNGGVYIGAGKETNMSREISGIASTISKSSPEVNADTLEENENGKMENEKQNENWNTNFEKQFDVDEKNKVHNVTNTYNKALSLSVSENNEFEEENIPAAEKKELTNNSISVIAEELPKTITDFWQVLANSTAGVDAKNIDGVVVRSADLVNEYQEELFESKLTAGILELMNKIDSKPVILVSSAQRKHIEKIVEAELNSVRAVRNRDAYKNLWYCFDNVSHPEELVALKKLLLNLGFRRSSTFKIFLSIHSPHSIIALKGLLENDVDGVIIDGDMLLEEHMIATDLTDKHVMEYILRAISEIKNARTTGMFLITDNQLNQEFVEKLVDEGITALAFDLAKIYKYKANIAELESEKTQLGKKKRGRKRKEIDFGF